MACRLLGASQHTPTAAARGLVDLLSRCPRQAGWALEQLGELAISPLRAALD